MSPDIESLIMEHEKALKSAFKIEIDPISMVYEWISHRLMNLV